MFVNCLKPFKNHAQTPALTIIQPQRQSQITAVKGALSDSLVIIPLSNICSNLSEVDVEELRKEIKVAQYKAIEIDVLKDYIEQVLQQMLNKNITRTKFSQR